MAEPMRIDTSVMQEMKGYGAFDISACFNCGNCTAVCPLSKDNLVFPRRVIRYAQLGQRAHLAASREVWLCYYCAECSDTCPRQADPGAFMASARRFAIAAFDPTSIARWLHRSKTFVAGFFVVLSAALLGLLLAASPGLPPGHVTSETLLRFVPFAVLHWLGLAVAAATVAIMAATLVNMFWMISRAPNPGGQGLPDTRPGAFPLQAALRAARTTFAEIAGQRRYRDCDAGETRAKPWPLRRWFVHYSIMLGMLGLGTATMLDYLLKTPGSHVAIWSPIRLLGTCAGTLLMYGTSVAIVERLRKRDKYYAVTLMSDWLLLDLLWLLGLSGFVLELNEYVALGGWMGVVFLAHVVLALELILLLPFTKLSHVIYRPAVIWFTEFRRLRAVR